MKLIFAFLLLFLMTGCLQEEEPVTEVDKPVIEEPIEEEEKSPIEEEKPEYNLVLVFDEENHDFSLHEDGYQCWHTRPLVEPVFIEENRAYYLLSDEVYCFMWRDIRDPTFKFTLNGELVRGVLYKAKVIEMPGASGEYELD